MGAGIPQVILFPFYFGPQVYISVTLAHHLYRGAEYVKQYVAGISQNITLCSWNNVPALLNTEKEKKELLFWFVSGFV